MFKTLLKIRFQQLFASMFRGSKNKKTGNGMKILGIILAVYVLVVFFAMFGGMFLGLAATVAGSELEWFYFSIAGIMTVGFCFIGSVFMTKTQLYDAKDNELLLSMPIPVRYILASRMTALVIYNYFFESLIMIPCGVVYLILGSPSVLGVIFFLIAFILLPFMALTLSCIFGWLIAIISSRMRNKAIITTILSFAFLAAYMYFCFNMSDYINVIIENGAGIAEAIRRSVFPAYHLGLAISGPNVVSMLIFILCAVLPFALVYFVIDRSFIKIATANRGTVKKVYREQKLEVSSSFTAMLKKEFGKLFSCPAYILNGLCGGVLTLIASAVIFVKRSSIDAMASELEGVIDIRAILPAAACLILCATASMNLVSAPSISLEGRTLWILRSLPIRARDVLLAKAALHIAVCGPISLVSSALCVLAIRPAIADCLIIFLMPLAVTVFTALFGLIMNLKFPKFDWINETVPIKQGASTMIAMFASMGVIAVMAAAYIFGGMIIPREVCIWSLFVILSAVCILLYRYIVTTGVKIFNSYSA